MTTLTVRVTPKAKRNEIAGWTNVGGERQLRVKLCAPPVEGKANKLLVEVLAARLGLRPGDIHILTGEHHRVKTLRIAAEESDVMERLGA